MMTCVRLLHRKPGEEPNWPDAQVIEAEKDAVCSPPRRRSERNMASTAQPVSQGKPRLVASKMMSSPVPVPFATRPITLKKIVPRSRQIKESTVTPRRSPRVSFKEDKENLLGGNDKGKSPGKGDTKAKLAPSPPSCPLSSGTGSLLGGADVLSPINTNAQESPPEDQQDMAMAKRVRRSYSRLEVSFNHSFVRGRESPVSGFSDTSTPNHGLSKRHTLFGFDKLLVPEGSDDVPPEDTRTSPKLASTLLGSSVSKEPDTDIPGISFMKEKRKKKKVPQFKKTELDEWAAQMNAEFDEAERFDLLVE
ncbi:sororin isoform X2 [Sphaerodactylus townsendi]|uniref:sororin isoform X2 n=1 Tax=Sphaerodactylus townsendi TaxID=933632 RepID=UPI00202626F4|nr:sororin isoform X2 [Sphaerodactylus townsendi]